MTSERAPSGSGRDLLSADLIGQRSFAVVRRGFERDEVQEFLKQVAAAVRTLHQRVEEADEARREAEQRALHPEINEDVLMERVGEETASILRSARAAAGDMRTRAAEEATRIVDEAHQRAGDIRGEAETAMARSVEEANRSAEELRAAAKAAGDQMVERARHEVESLRQMAEQERKLTIEGAQAIREKILADLGRRRRVATVQIEQLRAGRERLLESYGVVRRTLEEVQDELQRADAEARGAAEQVGRGRDEDDSLDLLPDLVGAAATTDETGTGATGEEPAAAPDDPVPVTPSVEEPAAGDEAPVPDVPDAVAEAAGHADNLAADGGEEPAPAEEVTGSESETPGSESPGSEGPGSEWPGLEAGDQTGQSKRKTGQRRSPSRPASRRREVPGEQPPTAVGRPSSAMTSGVDEAKEAAASAEDAASAHVVTAPEPGLAADDAVEGEGEGAQVVAGTEPTEPTEAGQDDGGTGSPTVDGLFARIRAGREEAVTQARQVLSGQTISSESAPGSDDDTDSGLARTTEDEALLERREATLGEVEVILTRKLKRALQDEQNSLLDRLRSSRGEPDPGTLLGPVSEHRQRYIDAALPQLELAGRAGSRFALEVIRNDGRKVGAPKRPAKVDDLAAELAVTLSDQIRRRVEQAVESERGDDHAAMTEALGAAYRETKTQRVERTAGDQVTAAFSRGIWEAAGDRVPLRWVVEDIDGPCPDCDDNALAGALPRHEGFPTGQAHPPAHTGCRCLVVPDLR
ncbi:MAG: DivIVA domain-containing protein [Actinomycetota bacterium]|nr:DivIVA domain-containing protein [Actinomycetota bacterium]